MASVRGRALQARLWLALAAGCTIGGVFTGTVLVVLSGLLSPIPDGVARWLFTGVAVLLLALDLTQRVLRLPQRATLIPQDVFARGMGRGALRFGVEYGSGFRTLVPSAASYVLAVYVLLAALPWWWGVLIGAVFGFSRSLPVLQYVLLGRPGWQQFLSGHTRVLERVGSVVTVGLLVLAWWR